MNEQSHADDRVVKTEGHDLGNKINECSPALEDISINFRPNREDENYPFYHLKKSITEPCLDLSMLEFRCGAQHNWRIINRHRNLLCEGISSLREKNARYFEIFSKSLALKYFRDIYKHASKILGRDGDRIFEASIQPAHILKMFKDLYGRDLVLYKRHSRYSLFCEFVFSIRHILEEWMKDISLLEQEIRSVARIVVLKHNEYWATTRFLMFELLEKNLSGWDTGGNITLNLPNNRHYIAKFLSLLSNDDQLVKYLLSSADVRIELIVTQIIDQEHLNLVMADMKDGLLKSKLQQSVVNSNAVEKEDCVSAEALVGQFDEIKRKLKKAAGKDMNKKYPDSLLELKRGSNDI